VCVCVCVCVCVGVCVCVCVCVYLFSIVIRSRNVEPTILVGTKGCLKMFLWVKSWFHGYGCHQVMFRFMVRVRVRYSAVIVTVGD